VDKKKGVIVVVKMDCNSNPPFSKTWTFWLPQGSIDAVLSLREKIHANRIFDIPDEQCHKQVVFHVKNARLTPAFTLLEKALREMKIPFSIIYDGNGDG